MAQVKLDYQGLKDQAKIIADQRDQFQTLVDKVMTTMKQLDAVWSDDAARDFTQKVQEMQPTFKTFFDTLDGLQAHMVNVSTKYSELSTAVKNAQRF